MKKSIYILFIAALNFIAAQAYSQKDTVINGQHYTTVDKSIKRKGPPLDSTFVINNKKLKFYNTWITGGAGVQQNLSYKRALGFAGGVDLNVHIQRQYFQLGTIITGEHFGFYNNYEFHLGYGKRFEDKDFHTAAFVGISYSSGYGKVNSTQTYERPYRQPGVYVQGELIKKIAYDVGIGVSLFGDFNAEQSIIGARALVYFSGAYKGKFNDQYRGN